MQYRCVNMVWAKEFCAIVTKSNRVELRSAQWSESRSCSAPQERTSGSENYPWWQSTLFNELRTLHSVCNTHGIISQLCNTLHGTERAPLCTPKKPSQVWSVLHFPETQSTWLKCQMQCISSSVQIVEAHQQQRMWRKSRGIWLVISITTDGDPRSATKVVVDLRDDVAGNKNNIVWLLLLFSFQVPTSRILLIIIIF